MVCLKLDVNKLIKPITETAYLNTENTNRYRPIMRFFYYKYEQAENWLYKEEVYEVVKDQIKDYTLEECQRDLDFLVEKLSLTTIQDTENASTLEKFKFKNYRYQLTDYAIEIERMTIRLEEMKVKVASLEPRLFERIKLRLEKLLDMRNYSNQELFELWTDLMQDFTNLNQSYQDFLKKFNEPKTEELLQSELFIQHKNSFIHYLQDFIKEFLATGKEISDLLKRLTKEDIVYFMEHLILHQKSLPQVIEDFDYDYLRTVNTGKWNSFSKWFYNEKGMSEGERLLNATNHIISKITKYASSLMELRGNMINRKEEYKYLCHLFDSQTDMEQAHTLAGTILGIQTIRHFKGVSQLDSDSIIPSLEVRPTIIKVDPMKRGIRSVTNREPIADKRKEKEAILKAAEYEEQRQRKSLKNLIKNGYIDLSGKVHLTPDERSYILNLMVKARTGIGEDPVFGLEYTIKDKKEDCQIVSSDGVFYMKGIYIEFGGGFNG